LLSGSLFGIRLPDGSDRGGGTAIGDGRAVGIAAGGAGAGEDDRGEEEDRGGGVGGESSSSSLSDPAVGAADDDVALAEAGLGAGAVFDRWEFLPQKRVKSCVLRPSMRR